MAIAWAAFFFATLSHALGDGLLKTNWAQRWAFAQFTPLSKHPEAFDGVHERLGCESTALAQIMFFHRLCPTGSVSYTAHNFSVTAMDFDQEASRNGLCDWPSFATSPSPNATNSTSMTAVARYEYAAALIVEKQWGTGGYMLSHAGRAEAAAKHYGAEIIIVTAESSREVHLATISNELDQQHPVEMWISNMAQTSFHHVVVDGYRHDSGKFMVHLNVGHSGFDNGWYDYNAPICLMHAPDGTRPAGGGCHKLYDAINHKELMTIHPKPLPIIV